MGKFLVQWVLALMVGAAVGVLVGVAMMLIIACGGSTKACPRPRSTAIDSKADVMTCTRSAASR